MNPLIQRLANAIGATETINGSWLFALDPQNFSTSANYWQTLAELNEWPLVGGSWIQSVAVGIGVTQPVNGSWLEAIVIELENTEPEEE